MIMLLAGIFFTQAEIHLHTKVQGMTEKSLMCSKFAASAPGTVWSALTSNQLLQLLLLLHPSKLYQREQKCSKAKAELLILSLLKVELNPY